VSGQGNFITYGLVAALCLEGFITLGLGFALISARSQIAKLQQDNRELLKRIRALTGNNTT
jgi:hypothetical protein